MRAPKVSEVGYVRLVKRSEHDDELARSVGVRTEIPRHHFLKLLSTASKAVRIALEASHPEHSGEIRHAVASVATAMQVKAGAASRDFEQARVLVESLRAAGRLSESDVEAFARAGKFEETAVALAILCDLPIDVVERALAQDRTETILIIAKAVDFSWPTAKAVLRLRAGERGLSAQVLEQSLTVFHRLKRETAREVVKFQRKRQELAAPP